MGLIFNLIYTIMLGKKVKDEVTGFKGIAISRHEYFKGLTQYGVQPPVIEGKMRKVEYIESDRLQVIEDHVRDDQETSKDFPG